MVSYRAGAGAAGAVQDAAGLVLLPRRLELAATHAGATVLAHAAGSGGTTVPHAAGPGPGAVPDAADRVAVLVDAAGGSVAVLPLLAVLHVLHRSVVPLDRSRYLASVVLWIRSLVVFRSADEAHWW